MSQALIGQARLARQHPAPSTPAGEGNPTPEQEKEASARRDQLVGKHKTPRLMASGGGFSLTQPCGDTIPRGVSADQRPGATCPGRVPRERALCSVVGSEVRLPSQQQAYEVAPVDGVTRTRHPIPPPPPPHHFPKSSPLPSRARITGWVAERRCRQSTRPITTLA